MILEDVLKTAFDVKINYGESATLKFTDGENEIGSLAINGNLIVFTDLGNNKQMSFVYNENIDLIMPSQSGKLALESQVNESFMLSDGRQVTITNGVITSII